MRNHTVLDVSHTQCLHALLKLACSRSSKIVCACRVLDKGAVPHTRHVRGSNFCLINVFPDRIPGRAIIISVIDNVCKGASGQALQNMNVMMGCPESTAIDVMPVFP